ncbi:RNA polymerase sigma factor [Cellulomonas sp. URHB0016]
MAHWRAVLEEVVRDRRSALVAYACLFVVDRRDAEDLVHEAVVRTFARPRSVPDPRAAEGYVRQAVRTAFLDQTRRRRTSQDAAHLLHDTSAVRAAEEAAAASVDVRRALALLSPRERACVVLRFFDDLTVPEIATSLRLSDGAVKRYLSDGTRKLRATLQVDGPDDAQTWETLPVAAPEGRPS